MDGRFVIFAGIAAAEMEQLVLSFETANPEMRRRHVARDLMVLTSDGGDGVHLADVGYAAGVLFSHARSAPRIKEIAPGMLGETSAEVCRSLLRDHWGAYVAAVSHGGEIRVLRDPSAAMPAYYVLCANGVVISSDAATLLEAAPVSASVDFSAVQRSLAARYARTEDTVLVGVKELLRGHCLILRDGRVSLEEMWSPWSWVGSRKFGSDADAADAVREAVQFCTEAWASAYRRVLVTASGGLDSSIVAACLAKSSTEALLVTMATSDPLGDERRAARDLASGLGLRLFEVELDPATVDPWKTETPHLPWPRGRKLAAAADAICAQLADDHDVDGIFNGGGGDSVFCYLSNATPLSDRLRAEGPGAGAWQTGCDLSRMTDSSLIAVWKQGLRRAYFEKPRYKVPTDMSFLKQWPAEAFPLHPWLQAPQHSSPGQLSHIASILGIHNYVERSPLGGRLSGISPLLSQPVIELCLGIPTWRWCSGGVNRSIARQAFDDLPTATVRRVTKGSPAGFGVELFARHKAQIRDFLAGGLLDANGVLDVDALDAVLVNPHRSGVISFTRFMDLVDTEAWARNWSQVPRPTVRKQEKASPPPSRRAMPDSHPLGPAFHVQDSAA